MNKKILFISANLSNSQNGGALCSERNYKSICELCGSQNVILFKLTPFSIEKELNLLKRIKYFFVRILSVLFFRVNGSSLKIEREIISIIEQNKINTIFIDSSLNGILVRKIKRKKSINVKIISFCHNCELIFTSKQIRVDFFFTVVRLIPVFINEFYTVKFSDRIIVLNERDSFLLNKYYSIKEACIIPISLNDTFYNNTQIVNNGNKLSLLFVGSYFYANKQGIEWFIRKVLPNVDAELIIVGKDMNKLLQDSYIKNIPNLKIVSNVPDISIFYENVDVVIAPIFTGGGMKVKIAEALMFGKMIIGTQEAFEGYGRINTMIECNSAEEFIDIINNTHFETYSDISRNHFSEKYSYSSTLVKFKNILT